MLLQGQVGTGQTLIPMEEVEGEGQDLQVGAGLTPLQVRLQCDTLTYLCAYELCFQVVQVTDLRSLLASR